MHTSSDWIETHSEARGHTVLRRLLRLLWQAIRLPLLALLLLFEPFVGLVLVSLGFLGVVVAVILRYSGDLPHFPFWGMMACSISCMLLLMAYRALITVLSR